MTNLAAGWIPAWVGMTAALEHLTAPGALGGSTAGQGSPGARVQAPVTPVETGWVT